MNILTFDIEEWYVEKAFRGGRKEYYNRFDYYLGLILDLLDEKKISATFFCVGQMAVHFPEVIRRISEKGHEIGCHSNIHTWISKMSKSQMREDTRVAIDALQQCTGQRVTSYRAPAFSIGKTNVWAFEVLAECGIIYDASVFPAVRDFGGFSEFGQSSPSVIDLNGLQIKEFPICLTRLLGKEVAYSGGGYFRFFPFWFIQDRMKKCNYNMCYFHIGDLIPEHIQLMSKKDYEEYFKEPGTFGKRYIRYVKSKIGMTGAFDKMSALIRETDFVSVRQSDSMIDWENVPKVVF